MRKPLQQPQAMDGKTWARMYRAAKPGSPLRKAIAREARACGYTLKRLLDLHACVPRQDPWAKLVRAAQTLLDARDAQMITRDEWQALRTAVRLAKRNGRNA